jgi:transposase
MAYREVTMIEIKEFLRLWVSGTPKKRIAAEIGLDPKTVRRYAKAAESCGVQVEHGLEGLTEELVGAVIVALKQPAPHPHGDPWWACQAERATIEKQIKAGLRLTKIWRLLKRDGIEVPYSTLHRFAVQELGFGRKAATVPIVDGEPGHELQVDTGWVLSLEPDASGVRRRRKAFVFTPNVSRYRFVYPIERETTAEAIAACEAAWTFYGGIFRVLVVDNMRAIVAGADPLEARIIPAFREYTQARGFLVDAARVRRPKDKARVERAVRDVRDDCFAGERLADLDAARERALRWCRDEYGMRRHGTTGRMPREHFTHVEAPALLPTPCDPYDVPTWSTPKIARDHFAQVDRALYSLPTRLVGRVLDARSDRSFVRFYDHGRLVKLCRRLPPGGRHIDPEDYPTHKRAYAMRDIQFLQKTADELGPSIGELARRLLGHPLPWTRMRNVHALISLARRLGADRVDAGCATALAHDMISVHRLRRMLEAATDDPKPEPARALPPARFLRPAQHFALRSTTDPSTGENP